VVPSSALGSDTRFTSGPETEGLRLYISKVSSAPSLVFTFGSPVLAVVNPLIFAFAAKISVSMILPIWCCLLSRRRTRNHRNRQHFERCAKLSKPITELGHSAACFWTSCAG
jgi:hypothetical protein